jgi:hypothetical protein
VIEVTYDGFPAETGWSLVNSAGTLIASQPTGSFLTVGGTDSRAVFVAGGEYIFEMTDTFRDGICCENGFGEFKIAVNGEPVAVGGNGDFGDVVRETFDVSEAPTRPPTSAPSIRPPTFPNMKDEDWNRAAAVGSVVGGVVLIAAGAGLIYFYDLCANRSRGKEAAVPLEADRVSLEAEVEHVPWAAGVPSAPLEAEVAHVPWATSVPL